MSLCTIPIVTTEVKRRIILGNNDTANLQIKFMKIEAVLTMLP